MYGRGGGGSSGAPGRVILGIAVSATVIAATIAEPVAAQEDPASDAAARERIRAATETGERHEALARFVGEWEVEVEAHFPGAPDRPASGHSTYEWLIPGRWIGQRLTDDLFGGENESFTIIGYDGFARSYVVAGVSSFDNALNVSRGPAVDADGDRIVTYGTLDEYLTGELDKPYKVVTRVLDPDHHVVEVWGLGDGTEGTLVLEYRYTRVP